MELILAEKPKVANKIAYALGDSVSRKTYNKVSYYEVDRGGKTLIVAPAVGHLFSLSAKDNSRGYPVFDVEWKPSFKISKTSSYTKPYLDLIEALSKKADIFISACDYDIEGSTIAYNVFRFATSISQGKRMKYSALTKNELNKAYETAFDFDYNNAYAGEARHVVDWYYGINLSRALMSALRKANKFRIMSIGRVQGPALAILSQLELKIKEFVPEPYWEIKIKLKSVDFLHKEGRIFDENRAKEIYSKISDSSTISSKEEKDSEVYPLPNFDLTSLQVEAYKNFKYSPSYVLSLAQELYEASLITYPRTASQKIPNSINVKSILSSLKSQKEYSSLVDFVVSKGRSRPVQGKKEDPAHPAIHPTGQQPKSLSGPHKNLYDLIVRRFIASFAPPAIRRSVKLLAVCGGELFVAQGSRLIDRGWADIYVYWKPEEIEFPDFSKGEVVGVDAKRKTKKETKPPKRYSPASIVTELERRHLGTKATRSVIVDTLFKRGYVKGVPIEVSDFGLKLYQILDKYAPRIIDEDLTRYIEQKMDQIVEGKIDKDSVISESREILENILSEWKSKEDLIGKELAEALEETIKKDTYLGDCDKCDGTLKIIKFKGKQFVGCTNYPNCKNAYPLPSTTVYPKSVCKCGKPTVLVFNKNRKYSMCIDPKCPTKNKKSN